MTSEIELLPCPFCGEKAEIERRGTGRYSTIYACTSCSCRLETGEEWEHGRGWNERDGQIEAARWKSGYLAAVDDVLALRDALENLTIAIGMGWDLEGVIAKARAVLDQDAKT